MTLHENLCLGPESCLHQGIFSKGIAVHDLCIWSMELNGHSTSSGGQLRAIFSKQMPAKYQMGYDLLADGYCRAYTCVLKRDDKGFYAGSVM